MAVRSALTPTWATVQKIGLALPDVEAGTSWGSPALLLRGTMFACVPTNKQAEKDSIVLRLDVAQRDELLAAEPEVYYLEEHYVNYPCVLVRLKKVHPDALRDLVGMARAYVDQTARRRRSVRAKKRRP
jgi:hypothetical protein